MRLVSTCFGSGSWSDERTRQTDLFARSDFTFHVKLRGGIFADKDSGQTGANPSGGEDAHFVIELDKDFVADFEAIKDAGGHEVLTFAERKEMISREEQWPLASLGINER
jgi:hypothetical protein